MVSKKVAIIIIVVIVLVLIIAVTVTAVVLIKRKNNTGPTGSTGTTGSTGSRPVGPTGSTGVAPGPGNPGVLITKITLQGTRGYVNPVSVTELYVYQQNGSSYTNIANQATATQSSTHDPSTVASNAIDGNVNTYSSTNSLNTSDTGPILTITFPSAVRASYVSILNRSGTAANFLTGVILTVYNGSTQVAKVTLSNPMVQTLNLITGVLTTAAPAF